MKTKPLLLMAACVIILIAGLFLFLRRGNTTKPDKADISKFLYGFSNRVNEGNSKAIFACFDANKKAKALVRLVNLLAGKKGLNGKDKPTASIKFDIDEAIIKIISADYITAVIPVKFSHDSLNDHNSALLLKIRQVAPHRYKIIQADARQFFTDYAAYENYVRSKTVNEKDIFSPITLAAFKTAGQLRARYDSVLWFEHVDGKTFYFVMKGKLGKYYQWPEMAKETGEDLKGQSFKMGLVNPDLKEIIPAEYDLVHNIGGTIDSLIEVEKDGKKGFYDLEGKLIVAVKYDQVFPLNDVENVALLRDDDNYYYLTKDLTITDKIFDFKISDAVHKIKLFGKSYELSDKSFRNVMEYNSREDYNSLIVAPSFLVDLQILPKFINFQNPLRHTNNEGDGDETDGDGIVSYKINFDGWEKNEANWFEVLYHSIVDEYLGARAGLDESKNLVLINKKQNRVMGFQARSYYGNGESGGALCGKCHENDFRLINDTLFEFKTTSYLDKYEIIEGPFYHYLQIRNGELIALPDKRIFNCTAYVKMDDSYLSGCYIVDDKVIDNLTVDMLQTMKNEIFASYGYQFKNKKWTDEFYGRYGEGKKVNVDDSLTVIDKYNINWINNKLKQMQKPVGKTLAAK